jgi:hypothetical protein
MAQLYTTGPALLYAGPMILAADGGGGAALGSSRLVNMSARLGANQARFLGTCEAPPKIKLHPHYKPVFNDLRGDQVAWDKLYLAEDAWFSGVVNRFNWPVWNLLNSPPNVSGALAAGNPVGGDVMGSDIAGSVGSLVVTEGMAMTFYVVFPYFQKPAYGPNRGMPPGYRFLACTLEPQELDIGLRDSAVHLVVHAIPVFSPGIGGSLLYDFAVGGLPPPD